MKVNNFFELRMNKSNETATHTYNLGVLAGIHQNAFTFMGSYSTLILLSIQTERLKLSILSQSLSHSFNRI